MAMKPINPVELAINTGISATNKPKQASVMPSQPQKAQVPVMSTPKTLPATGVEPSNTLTMSKKDFDQHVMEAPKEIRSMVEKQLKAKYKVEGDEPSSMAGTAAKVALGGLGGILGSSIAGEVAGHALEKTGKAVYGLTLPPTKPEAEAMQSYEAGTSDFKPKSAVETALDAPFVQKGGRTMASKVGMMGTRSQLGTQSEAFANNLWKNSIDPLLTKSTSTIDINSIIDDVVSNIGKYAKEDPDKLNEYIDAGEALKEAFSDPKYAALPLKNTQVLKSGLQQRAASKFWKGKEIADAYGQLKGKLSSKLVSVLHDTIQKEFGVDSAQLFRDYANAEGLSEIGPLARTEAGRKGGAGTLVSWLSDTLATPVTTVTGKLGYKLGQGLKKLSGEPIKTAIGLIKKAASKPGLKNVAKIGKLVSVIEDGGLVPGSPSNIAQTAMYTDEKDKVYVKGTKMWVPKAKLTPVPGLKKEAVATDLGYIDKDGNVWN